jgi:hypothetical protein
MKTDEKGYHAVMTGTSFALAPQQYSRSIDCKNMIKN